MKALTFDKEAIRSYMMGSEVLKQGIKYCKVQNPSISDLVAEESAIIFAQQKCYDLWKCYDYIYDEFDAFRKFSECVDKHEYFNTKDYDKKFKEEEQLRKNEAERRDKLATYCVINNLSFEEENRKQLIELYKRDRISNVLFTLCGFLFISPIVLLLVADWFISNSERFLIPFLILSGVLVAFAFIIGIVASSFSANLPKTVIEKARDEFNKTRMRK